MWELLDGCFSFLLRHAHISYLQTQSPPYQPVSQVLGNVPTKGLDIPICAVFMVLYIGGAVVNQFFLITNKKKGKKFGFCGMMFG